MQGTGRTYAISGETTEWEDILIKKGITTKEDVLLSKGLNPEDVSLLSSLPALVCVMMLVAVCGEKRSYYFSI